MVNICPELAQLVARYDDLVESCVRSRNVALLEQHIEYIRANYSFRIIEGYGNWADYLVPILYEGVLAIRG